jgi:hypothetical protein
MGNLFNSTAVNITADAVNRFVAKLMEEGANLILDKGL